MTDRLVYLGLGSNLGQREHALARAVRALMDDAPGTRAPILTDIRLSNAYETEPVGIAGQPRFLNAVVEGKTTLEPEALLAAAKRIERDLGRQSREPGGPREIDVDVLWMDGVARADGPALPHPRCRERAFVLRPWADLAPDLALADGRRVRDLLDACDATGVRFHSAEWGTIPRDDTRDLVPVLPGDGGGRFEGDPCPALRAFGAVRIEGALEPDLVRYLLQLAARAFASDERERETARRGSGRSGYTPPGVERVRGHAPDLLRHFWDFGDEARAPTAALGEFYQVARHLSGGLTALLGGAFAHLDRAYGTTLVADARGGDHLLRLSGYLNADVAPTRVLFPSHLDFGLLTAYLGGSVEGLQVKVNGIWHDLHNPPGSVVLGVGTTLRMLAPELPALPHRVVGSRTGRLSAMFFTELRPEIRLPNGRTAGEHLARHMGQART